MKRLTADQAVILAALTTLAAIACGALGASVTQMMFLSFLAVCELGYSMQQRTRERRQSTPQSPPRVER
ncbi:hypothetical protein ACNHUS_35215 [Actinomycetes bacterium M1A6_2h]